MNPSFIASQWATLCHSAHASASRLSQGVSAKAADHLQSEAVKFCGLAPPQDKESLEAVYTQRMALSARLTAIGRADAMARVHPDAAEQILAEVHEFCATELPATSEEFLEMQKRNIELTRSVAKICEYDLAARLNTD